MKKLRDWRMGAKAVSLVAFLALVGCCILDRPPTPDFTWYPLEPLCFERVQFTDRSMDMGGPLSSGAIVAWSWDFGDNRSSSLQNPTHCYTKPGSYRVFLRVTDNCGQSADVSREIRVEPNLTGTWDGWITDLWRRTFMLRLVLNHSRGGITGTAYVDIYACPLASASLSRDQVQVSFVYPGSGNQWLLTGSYDPNRELITGIALNMDWAARQFGNFEVRRTTTPTCSFAGETLNWTDEFPAPH